MPRRGWQGLTAEPDRPRHAGEPTIAVPTMARVTGSLSRPARRGAELRAFSDIQALRSAAGLAVYERPSGCRCDYVDHNDGREVLGRRNADALDQMPSPEGTAGYQIELRTSSWKAGTACRRRPWRGVRCPASATGHPRWIEDPDDGSPIRAIHGAAFTVREANTPRRAGLNISGRPDRRHHAGAGRATRYSRRV